jgi:hypothetical protein
MTDYRIVTVNGKQAGFLEYIPGEFTCPYIGKAVEELPPVAEQFGILLKLVESKDSAESR